MINKMRVSVYLELLSRSSLLNMSKFFKIFSKRGDETAVQKLARKCGKGMQNND